MIGRPQDVFPVLGPLRPALLFTIVNLTVILLGKKRLSTSELFKFRESKKYALFYMLMIIGIPFAYHRREAFNYIFLQYLSNILFFYIFLIQIDSFKKLKTVLYTICLSTLFYGLFSLTKGSFASGRYSFGTMYDPNDLAYFLVSLFPLSIFYFIHNEGIFKRIIAIIIVSISISAILLTGSRGGFVGLIAVFILILFTRLNSIKWSYRIALLTGVILISVLYSEKINTERFLTLREISSDYNVTDEFGRVEVWKRGLRLALSNPITGVGVNCFGMAIGYAREAEGVIPRWQVAHNSFIQVATEVGLIGFAVFISIVLGCVKNFSDCKKLESLSVEIDELKTIAGLLKIAFIGLLITAFFLTHGYSILFTLLFAFSAILRKMRNNLNEKSIIQPI